MLDVCVRRTIWRLTVRGGTCRRGEAGNCLCVFFTNDRRLGSLLRVRVQLLSLPSALVARLSRMLAA